MTDTTLPNLGNLIKSNAATVALPLIAAFAQNVEANATPANFLAQLMALKVELLAGVPNLEQGLIKALMTDIQAKATAELSKSAAT